jgi:hypothetical protein
MFNQKYYLTKNNKTILLIAFILFFHVFLLSISQTKLAHLKLDELMCVQVEFNPKEDFLAFFKIEGTNHEKFERAVLDNLYFKNNDKRIKKACDFAQNKTLRCLRDGGENPNWYLNSNSACLNKNSLQFKKFKNCIREMDLDANNIRYFTILRDPVSRYLAEFDSFKSNKCSKTNFEKFIDCEQSIIDKQVKMLASPLNTSENDFLLEIAKQNLNLMMYFGIAEQPDYSLKLFQKMFSNHDMNIDLNSSYSIKDFRENRLENNLNENLIAKIRKVNALDVEFYKYAQQVFIKRLKFFNII